MPKASTNPTQRPKKRATQTAPEPRSKRDAFERILAVLVVVFAGIAVLGFAASLLRIAFQQGNAFFDGIVWQYAFWLPLVSLPLMIVCVVVLVISSVRGKSRDRR
ncbi:hypothetical protein [Agrococcus sp. Marseille-P2731]|uniref:hypothetical protein n=1 Tax=Agrococcus sp. Marseille-P2731 TaxID=1841862 RepID=UPI000930A6E8|nr:hypothetical protein [Agrococcus sp. Marseille-P2731]